MEHKKVLSLLNESSDSNFVTRNRIIVSDQSNPNYDVGNEIICNIEVLKSNFCGYNDAYILVRGDISIVEDNGHGVAFKSCATFTKCITKIDGKTIDDAEDLDLVMPMYNLLEYSSNYSNTTASLRFYFRANNFKDDIGNTNNFKPFEYKAISLGGTVVDGNNGILRDTAIAVPLNYLSNFWRSLEMSLINCKVELKLKWTNYCVLSAAGAHNANTNSNNIIFTITDTKLYVPVITLAAKENQKLSKLLIKGLEKSVYLNEYETKSENKNTTNEYRYFLESNFVGVNRLFILIYTNENDDAKRFKARRYYLPKGVIKN